MFELYIKNICLSKKTKFHGLERFFGYKSMQNTTKKSKFGNCKNK